MSKYRIVNKEMIYLNQKISFKLLTLKVWFEGALKALIEDFYLLE
jgi:hypothetical protein